MKKKILAFLLACTLAVGMAASPVGMETVMAEVTTGDGFTYTISSWSNDKPDGLSISKYTGDAATLNIPSVIDGIPVEYIGPNAFAGCNKLVSVTIPDSVIVIRDEAFKGCTSLASITIPDNVNRGISIGKHVFEGCTSLTSLTIPACVDGIGAGILNGCSNTQVVVAEDNPHFIIEDNIVYNKEKTTLYSCLNASIVTDVTIPDSVTTIGQYAFERCNGLTSITIPNGVTEMGDGAFQGCSGLTSVTIPNSVTEMGSGAFQGCSGLTSIMIPNSVTSIGFRVFKGCTSLTGITIPNSVTSIGDYAFEGCTSLTSLTIPASVQRIGRGIVNGCSNIAQIALEESNPYLTVEENIVFNKEKTLLYSYLKKENLINVIIPDGVTCIPDQAFAGATSLTSVTIPASVTTIRDDAFRGCTSLTSIDIPEGVEMLGDYAFADSGLTTVNLPSSLTRIDGAVFSYTGLSSITIPANVSRIGPSTFRGCNNLTQISVDENNPNYMAENGILYDKGKTTVMQCLDTEKKRVIPDGVTKIDGQAFSSLTNLTSIAIPASVTGIGSYTFYESNNLTDIYYAGSQEQWEKIELIGWGDEKRTITRKDLGIGDSVTIHYNSTMPAEPGTADKPDNDQNKDQNNDQNKDQPENTQKSKQTITAKNITKTYGAKAFSLNARVNTGTALTYASSDKKVATINKKGKITIKGCGITKITITAPETDQYSQAKKTIKLTVKPKKVTFSSVKSTKKKTATVKWKQDKKASGYIIQFATDSKFKKNKFQTTVSRNKTVSSTVKKLKAGKKYYVRVCAYAKSGKTKIQGDWSKVKTVKVKK